MMHAEMGSTALWLLLLLGAYHGINPGMGWLFAVALGMQERKGSAVAKALVPIALGHALAIGSVVLAAAFLRHGAAAGRHPLLRRRSPARSGDFLPGAPSPPALGPYAGGLPRLDLLVVPDGLGPRRGFDGAAGAAGAAARSKPPVKWRATITPPRARSQRCSPPGSIRQLIWRSQGSLPGSFTANSALRFSAKPGSTSTGFGPSRS